MVRTAKEDGVSRRESGAARGNGPSVHHRHVPAELAGETHERNDIVAAAEDDKRNRRLQEFQKDLGMAAWQRIGPGRRSAPPECLPGILIDPRCKPRIADVIPEPATAGTEQAGAVSGAYRTTHAPDGRQYARLTPAAKLVEEREG